MAILAKTITPTGVELNYHRIGEYFENDEKIVVILFSYLSNENRQDFQPTYRSEITLPRYDHVDNLTNLNTNHLSYAYVHIYHAMVNGNFNLKIAGEITNDEPVNETLNEAVQRMYEAPEAEVETIEDEEVLDNIGEIIQDVYDGYTDEDDEE